MYLGYQLGCSDPLGFHSRAPQSIASSSSRRVPSNRSFEPTQFVVPARTWLHRRAHKHAHATAALRERRNRNGTDPRERPSDSSMLILSDTDPFALAV